MRRFLKPLFDRLFTREQEPILFPEIFERFQNILLQDHHRVMEIMADLGEKSCGDFIFDRKYLQDSVRDLQDILLRMAKELNLIGSNRYMELYSTLDRVLPVETELSSRLRMWNAPYVVSLRDAPVDNPELTGGKANTLAEIIQRLHLDVPDGFVITSQAYYRFLEQNHLSDRIQALLRGWMAGDQSLDKACSELRERILAGAMPQDVAEAIRHRAQKGKRNWSVRSSAYGEDGELSFAGLHQTLLNVAPAEVLEAYKIVLASLYSPESISYRHQMGVLGDELAMSVLCQEMIDSQASGVLQTVCPESAEPGCMAIYASFGLGRTTAEGRDVLDQYIVEKEPPHEIREATIAQKEFLLRPAINGGEEESALSLDKQSQPAISQAVVRVLANWGVVLERYFRRALEIEWAVDAEGRCELLQSRPLILPQIGVPAPEELCAPCTGYKILLRDTGVVAQPGVGSGLVRIVQLNEDMADFPDGAVLVTRYTAPWLARIVPKARAIISERGSVAGHLATIAREFRVPALIGVEKATDILVKGMEITLDAHHRVVYEGRVEELIHYQLMQPTVFEDAPEFRLLRRILNHVAPLHLTDPQSINFSPKGCRSVHDMIRFIHEKAVQELMDLPTSPSRFKGAKIWTLVSDVPMPLKILDLGGGLDPLAEGSTVRTDQIRSLPLKALLAGLSKPGTWDTEPVVMDFKGMIGSLTRTWDPSRGPALFGLNLAVVNDIYMNLHLRLGYHLNLIDARMDAADNQNHIYFRFMGGVADLTRRSRRAQLLADILAHYHFKVRVQGDLVVGRILHISREEIQRRLEVIGALVGFTRQLDIQLRKDQDIDKHLDTFFHKYDKVTGPGVSVQP
ncbi:MAG: PEP/pyruvate-binding domain-containing protein [Desulfomonilaceae bacterium]